MTALANSTMLVSATACYVNEIRWWRSVLFVQCSLSTSPRFVLAANVATKF